MQANREFIIDGIGLLAESLPKPIDWKTLYGNDHPVELEIGMGKGTFLTDQAIVRKDTNFFGIEWANFFWKSASDRLRRNHCTNARTIRTEALFFLREFVADNSLSVLHVYFPDPWPKKRHHKRRLIQEPFMKQAERVLKVGGRLQVVTDHRGYFEENMEPAFQKSSLVKVDYSRPGSANEGEFVGTNFERKYRKEGRPFYALAGEKRTDGQMTNDQAPNPNQIPISNTQ